MPDAKNENRDPIECRSCGTVNVWSAVTCRSCGEVLSSQTQEMDFPAGGIGVPNDLGTSSVAPVAVRDAEATVTEGDAALPGASRDANPEKRRWNIFWIVLGIALHVIIIHVGVFGVIKTIERDKELKPLVERILKAAQSSDKIEENRIYESLSGPIQSKLSWVRTVLIFLLVLTPLLIGATIGFFTDNILEAAAALGLSAILIPLLNNVAFFAVLWGPVNAGLGTLGAYLACRLKQRNRFRTDELN